MDEVMKMGNTKKEFQQRTDDEILKRIDDIKGSDPLGFSLPDLIGKLPFNLAKPWLREEVTEDEWKQEPRDRESIIKEMREYMPFAWEKANNCRGISAGRSLNHFSVWVWFAGDDLGDLNEYEFYGKDNLIKICEHYGFEIEDDGIRVNTG